MTQAQVINPEHLKALRKRKGWTQLELSEHSHCSKKQIERWEQGKTKVVRKASLERLANAFGVSPDTLCKPLSDDDSKALKPRITMKLEVRPETQNALAVISRIFHVTRQDIVDLAPLLFMISAQQSLRSRHNRLLEAKRQVESAIMSANQSMSYMDGAFRGGFDDDWIEEEIASIKKRQVFQDYSTDTTDHSPFVDYLKKMMDDAGISHEDWGIFASYSSAPWYSLPLAILRQIVVAPDDGELFEKMLSHLQSGNIDIESVIEQGRRLESNEYSAWVDGECERMVHKSTELAEKLFDLNLRVDKAKGGK